MKILILEDEFAIRSFVALNLKREGYQVIEAETGEEALRLYDENRDIEIAILDVMLPGITGFDVCKEIRTKNPALGIIMLTARTQETDKIQGLDYGADDYITKPFSPKELMARIRSLGRRIETPKIETADEDLLKSEPFFLYPRERKFIRHEEEIDLTPTEFQILELFLRNKDKSLSRDQILNEIWGKNYIGDLKVVDVNIRRIRRKIEEDPANPKYLKTIWGFGYRWEEA